jgi:hypothetical protein
MDSARRVRETWRMAESGSMRERLAGVLQDAFAEGLLSEHTLAFRLGLVFGPRLIDPDGLVGDLSLRPGDRRRPRRSWRSSFDALRRQATAIALGSERRSVSTLVLALEPGGEPEELIVGRDRVCSVHLCEPTVSRRHARLLRRDGSWIIEDLGSTNGTLVNGARVGRCALRAGDRVRLGLQPIQID